LQSDAEPGAVSTARQQAVLKILEGDGEPVGKRETGIVFPCPSENKKPA
jgi:hypothetical protein